MAEKEKVLVRFNIKNAKYALQTADGWSSPVPFGYSDSIALEANYSEKMIYGDGRVVYTAPNDKGKTGTLTLLTIDDDYEIAMKRKMRTAKGLAEIKQLASVPHAIYFETDYIEGGVTKTAKTVVYGVTSGRPSQSFSQTTEDINNNNTDYPLTIKGVPMQDASGNIYKDSDGNIVYAWQETSVPGDAGYEDFGSSISFPTPFSSTPTGL